MERDVDERSGGQQGEQKGPGQDQQGGYGGHAGGADPRQGENDQDGREGGYGGDDPTDLDPNGENIGA